MMRATHEARLIAELLAAACLLTLSCAKAASLVPVPASALASTAQASNALASGLAITASTGQVPTRYAIVTQDHTALRAGPKDSGTVQAVLWQGDTLEVRGQRLDYVQVYDHRRERAGYVRATQVRVSSLSADEAPELLAVMRFVRDTPGAESLGLAYSAAYLKAAQAGSNTSEAWDAMGQMAERLAKRASLRSSAASTQINATPSAADTRLSGQLEGVAAFGVRMQSLERDSGMQLCYDGEAYGRVLAQTATPEQRGRAALGLTRHDCQAPATPPTQTHSQNLWRAKLLDQAISAQDWPQLSALLKNRIQIRRAGLWATLAFEHSRALQADPLAAQKAGKLAIDALAAVVKTDLTDEDQTDYQDAAVRVSASRWAASPLSAKATDANRLHIQTRPGQPGETCVLLMDAKHDAKHPLMERCTFGVVWTNSATSHAKGHVLTLAVQPLSTWRELWLFRQTTEGWVLDVLPPGVDKPELGYVEWAGFDPSGERLLLAREALRDSRPKHSFEVMRLSDLSIEKQASSPSLLAAFGKWQSAVWKSLTVSLR